MDDLIVQLSDHVANQIAAGEVVNRPASVVKELVENAVDAGATEIVVVVKDAGRTLIQVIDNGRGMGEMDARRCFTRHATSKITSADDLLSLVTKGFRGEALASIAAISHVELKTRVTGADLGVKISVSGDQMSDIEEVACSEGSSFSVKNLFFNVPARRNFLKSDQVEVRHIVDEFQRVAMAHPDLSFRLQSNGGDLFNLKPGALRKRVVSIFGVKHDERLVPVEEETDVVKIYGFVGKPAFARRTRGEQFLFVNGRFIKHPLMHRAIMNAYEGVLSPGSFPLYTIFLDVDPSKIDVNIHPTKVEAKFEEDQIIFAMLRSAIKRALGKHNVAPSLDFESELSISLDPPPKGVFIAEPTVNINPNYNPFTSGGSKSKKRSAEASFGGFEKSSEKELDNLYQMFGREEEIGVAQESFVEEKAPNMFLLSSRFIVTESQQGVIVIDARRAHERVLFEQYLHAGRGMGSSLGQKLLFPEPISLSTADTDLLLGASEILMMFGLELESSNEGEVEVVTVPSGLAGRLQDWIDSVLGALKDGTWSDEEGRREKLAQAAAQAGALKLSEKNNINLTHGEMVDLVSKLFDCESPAIDSRGRAVYTLFSLENIETRLK
ncbi:MAG: DNA mismatch repair endonuclease MutL [Flavobacteriales bacterium]|jgi:DNA mismatch repair protein MutL